MSEPQKDISWHTMQAQARRVIAEAMSNPKQADKIAVDLALEVLRIPSDSQKPAV